MEVICIYANFHPGDIWLFGDFFLQSDGCILLRPGLPEEVAIVTSLDLFSDNKTTLIMFRARFHEYTYYVYGGMNIQLDIHKHPCGSLFLVPSQGSKFIEL